MNREQRKRKAEQEKRRRARAARETAKQITIGVVSSLLGALIAKLIGL